MGYTHHFPRMKDVSDEEWNRITEDFATLVKHLPKHGLAQGGIPTTALLKVAQDSYVIAPPLVDDEKIQFNGTGPGEGETELGCETFVLNRHSKDRHAAHRPPRPELPFGVDFCKTEHLPYDLLVCATLAVANEIAPGAWEITSNGGAEDWQPALDWASSVLGRPILLPFTKSSD